MRTTLTLDDDEAALAQNYANAHALRLRQAMSEQIRQARAPLMKMKNKNSLWVIAATPGATKVSAQTIKDLIDSSE